MNKLHIIGNLTKDPELRTTTTGVDVCTLNIAVNRKKTMSNPNPGVDYFKVTAWRELGKNAAKYLTKGKKVAVTGPVSVSVYETSMGKTGANLEVTAEDLEFLSPAGQTENTPAPTPAPTPSTYEQNGFTPVEDSDLPF